MDANHLRIEALLGVDDTARLDLKMRARSARPDAWVELQSERTPAPGRLNVFKRHGWNHLIELGRAQVARWIRGEGLEADGPRELEGWLVPVWRADNDVDEPASDAWGPAAVLLADSPVHDALFIDEMLPEPWSRGLPSSFRIRWMRQAVLRLVEDRGPSMSAVERAGGFALVRVEVDTLVAVLDVQPIEAGSVPTDSVPGYTERLVPVAGVSERVGIERIQQRLDALVPA
jgi:hypothetical protein